MKNNSTFDPLGRFYTHPKVSSALVNLLNAEPSSIVDLGSGGCSLSIAARQRWDKANITTIDIDKSAAAAHKLISKSVSHGRHTHVVSDILRADLPSKVLKNKSFGVIVCNPPYVSTDWQTSFGEILEDAGLSVLVKEEKKVALEILFLAQCLRLSDEGGLIALIVPDGLITGRKHAEFRKVLSERYLIETVMQLPEGSFQGTQARAFIMVVAKRTNDERKLKLLRMNKDGSFLPPIFISNSGNGQRLDYDYHSSKASGELGYSLADLGPSICRGTLSSAQIREIKYSKFHTSGYDDRGPATIRLGDRISRSAQESGCIIAEKGDILLARVDRALHKKIAFVSSGKAVLSDCVYRIRVAPALQKALFAYLCSPAAEQYLSTVSRGVGARMLPKHELLKMPLRMQICPPKRNLRKSS